MSWPCRGERAEALLGRGYGARISPFFLTLLPALVQGGQGNRLKGPVPGEPRCRLCALITLRAVHSDLEFAAPRDADLPDEGRAYVEHVTTPDSLRERSGGSQTSSELAMARASALRA